MCSAELEQVCSESHGLPSSREIAFSRDAEMDNTTGAVGTKISFSEVLELAADNNIDGFKQYIECNPKAVDEVGLWYGRQVGSKSMVLEYRTPLMVAASYGSIEVMNIILSLSEVDINCSCSPDKSTALHCAASGGSSDAVDAVKLLLRNGADPNLSDAKGHRPFDLVSMAWMPIQNKAALEGVLNCNGSIVQKDLRVSIDDFNDDSFSSYLEAPSSPVASKPNKKEYPVDPSLPDIKNSIYASDEFRMYSFKVRPCSRAYSHDWTECPFVHPGENARRRDPRKFHYSCVPCPEFRKGSCRRGDMCEYAHGVFECWLHPAQYRTRLCKDGTNCARRVCFFAHTPEELRPLYVSTGSAVPSPRSAASAAAVMDMTAALNHFPGSPSAAAGVSPSPFAMPLSPSGNGISHSSTGWSQQNIPTLHLPGSTIQANSMQTSRLRSSLNARDISAEELRMLQDLDMEQRHILNDTSCFSQPHFHSPSANLSAHPKSLVPSNLDELFSAEVSSPWYLPSHKSAVLNHFQHQQQSMLSPINTNVFSPKASFGASSPAMMSPRCIEPQSPMGGRLSAIPLHEKQQLRSLSARDLGANIGRDVLAESAGMVGSPVSGPWSIGESTMGKPDWSVAGDQLGRLKRSYTVGHKEEEPDLTWIQSLVKDSPSENQDSQSTSSPSEVPNSDPQVRPVDHSALGAWLDQLQLDKIVA